jgi:N-acetylneuraminic acid mutarotase
MMNIVHRLKVIGIGALIAFSLSLTMSPASAQTGFQTDPTCTLQLGAWQAAPTAPAGAYHLEGGGVVSNGRLYLLSGYNDGSFTIGNRVDVYDIQSATWLSATNPYAPTPFQNTHVQAAADGQYIWMAGGFPNVNGSVPWANVYRYNTLTDTWDVMPPLPLARASGALVVNSQTRMLHYFGGLADDRTTNQPDHWALNLNNPAAGWTALAPMPMPRNHFQALEINGVIYAAGGQFGHDGVHEDTVLLHAYDPATDTWQRLADMPLSRSHAETATFVVNERIVLVAGSDSVKAGGGRHTAGDRSIDEPGGPESAERRDRGDHGA